MSVINNNISRLSISIDGDILNKFFSIYPSGTRSKVIESLLAENIENRANRFKEAAKLIEQDPRFSQVREDTALWSNAELISE